ncbi:hypothetical protein N836_29695 [Leptolyngbya sp. Heron Island J]|uniref:FeoC-like transcriptional regulator n=1 Tax=Leptolyngbya sp. Heron Island J TaxID=1385935 RepID=UPI0003B9D580|nr:hypothetical protein [Leptolyngbya sp. Heron Island J]ESA38971.1 hypothetical protein N836_29695 [Leptolyngbya sp. Heron Island J]
MTHNVKNRRTMIDVLSLADVERSVVHYIMRQRRSTPAQLSHHFKKTVADIQPILNQLVTDGFLSKDLESDSYQIAISSRPQRPSAEKLWDMIGD